MTLERWQALCQKLHIQCDDAEYQRLVTAWQEPQRAYHTLQHLQECLQHWDDCVMGEDDRSALIECAVWYHDAVYHPRANDNECQSADWAIRYLHALGVPREKLDQVRRLIMVTCHDALPENDSQKLMLDIDLAILGADQPRFAEYGEQVRREYAHVPTVIYRYKRKAILKAFLKRKKIYHTARFYALYEARARANLIGEIARL